MSSEYSQTTWQSPAYLQYRNYVSEGSSQHCRSSRKQLHGRTSRRVPAPFDVVDYVPENNIAQKLLCNNDQFLKRPKYCSYLKLTGDGICAVALMDVVVDFMQAWYQWKHRFAHHTTTQVGLRYNDMFWKAGLAFNCHEAVLDVTVYMTYVITGINIQ